MGGGGFSRANPFGRDKNVAPLNLAATYFRKPLYRRKRKRHRGFSQESVKGFSQAPSGIKEEAGGGILGVGKVATIEVNPDEEVVEEFP